MVFVHAANIPDQDGTRLVLERLREHFLDGNIFKIEASGNRS
jgi:hypothetical protein